MSSTSDDHAHAHSGRPRLRLLKAVVQLVFVIDDDENLVERVAEPVVVPAGQWPSWASEEYPALFAQLQHELDEQQPPEP